MQSTNNFISAIITLFSTLTFVAILVVIFGVIIRRQKKLRKKQRPKNEKNHNQFKFDDGVQNYENEIFENEENSYEMINYDQIYQNESKFEANTSKTVEYLDIFE